jgi:hypothetical protein
LCVGVGVGWVTVCLCGLECARVVIGSFEMYAVDSSGSTCRYQLHL